MTARARLFVALSLALSTIAAGTRSAAADNVLTAIHLAPQDAGPAGGQPLRPAPPPTTQTPPMFEDVTGPAKPMALPELLQLAVRQAPALAQAQIDMEVAEANVLAATAWADWALQAQGSGSANVAFDGDSAQAGVRGSVDLSKRLGTGGTLTLHGDTGGAYDKRESAISDTNPLGIPYTTKSYDGAVNVTLLQPLMRDRGNVAAKGAESVARANRDAAAVARQAAAIQLVQTVVLSYLDLVDAERQLEIRRGSLDLAKERLRVTIAGIDKGGVAKAETIPVEQAIATREEEVLVGEMQILDLSLALRRQVSLPSAKGDMMLKSTVDLAIPSRTWDQNAIVAAAEQFSPELARLAALEKGATIDVDVTENGLLPQLDLALTVGPGFQRNTEPEKDLIAGAQGMVSLTYQQALGKTAAKASVRRARAQLHSVKVTAIDVHNQLVETAAVAVATIQVAERRYAISQRAVTLAEQNLAVEQARLGLGKSRNVDVLLRQDELRAAQLRASVAITDWHRSAAAIAALTGEILPQYGITLDESR